MPMTGDRLDELDIPPMINGGNTATHGTAFTVSVDFLHRTTTGISAHDRAETMKALIDPKSVATDFARPGHLFPLRYMNGGVLIRPGYTEAAVDMSRMAGLKPAGVICEITNPDGTMARMTQLEEFSVLHSINIISIGQIVAERRRNEVMIKKVATARLPTIHGDFEIVGYSSLVDPGEHMALVKGAWDPNDAVLVRLHSECLTGNVFSSLRCDCGEQINRSLDLITGNKSGVLLYIRQEGRGIGLHNKIRAYSLQDQGMDTIEANEELGFESDHRHFTTAAQILIDLGIKKVRLITNNPRKVVALTSHGIEVVERVPIKIEANDENRVYLETKRVRMGHLLANTD